MNQSLNPLGLLDVQVWNVYWAELARRIGSIFARSDVRTRAMDYLAGLLSPAERKNSWQLAEICGNTTPYGFQHVLGRSEWNPDALRDRLFTYVDDYLYDPDAVGVLDESGFLKKGTHSAGVARQYSGTAGRVENCQVGVFFTYATRHGHTMLDRELYLPAVWTDDRERCHRAGIPADRRFATKPVLAQHMVDRTVAAGIRVKWMTGDCVYGNDRPLRLSFEARDQAYVLAVSGHASLWVGHHIHLIKPLLEALPAAEWQRISAGAGSKGPRWYDWQRVALNDPSPAGWRHWLVVRRSISDPTDLTTYLAYAPADTPLDELVRVAGMRWTVEESIQTAKGEVGMDHYEVRSWTGWYRHMTLAMWAQAFLTVIRAEEGAEIAPKKGRQNQPMPSSLAQFKAHRGLLSG